MPYTPNTEDSDFFFMREKDDEKLNDDIVGLVCDRLPKKYDIDPKEIQVLTPMKKNNAGSIQLNKMLQERINPIGPEIKHGDTIFRLGDKVIQTKNNYEKDIFNGDTGIINSVNMEDKTLTVDFGDSVIFYDQTDLDELMLSYALTIHKSQGSE
jgi:exodeoxyribonuclease V alpha subunit